MADTEKTAATLLAELAALDPPQRREVAKELRKVAENFAGVPDGRNTAHTLRLLAHARSVLMGVVGESHRLASTRITALRHCSGEPHPWSSSRSTSAAVCVSGMWSRGRCWLRCR